MSEDRRAGGTGDEELERDYGVYRDCFNREQYYEAHDALEPLWLRVRDREVANLLKGLIQLAGAFVHIQKGRVGPARALLGRARFHLEPFLVTNALVDVSVILGLIRKWEGRLETATAEDRLLIDYAPPALPGKKSEGF